MSVRMYESLRSEEPRFYLPLTTGKRWSKTRRPALYHPLTIPTGKEQDTRAIRFEKRRLGLDNRRSV